MRGLNQFIGDIRNCKNEAAIEKRVAKELAKIRAKFSIGVKGYDLKKYVWKLVYIYMLGFEVDIGYMEAVQLISASKYSEKCAGHTAVTLMLNENNEVLRLIIQAMKKDLTSGPEEVQCLALATIANVGGEEFAEALAADVIKLLTSSTSRNFVRKKAALALLRLYRRYPDIVNSETFADSMVKVLEDPNLGVVLSSSSLLLALCVDDPEPYSKCIPILIKILDKLIKKDIGKGYIYYKTACPWLQVKILQILQKFPPPEDKDLLKNIGESLASILTRTEVTESVNKNNSDYSILFEALNLITRYNLLGAELLLKQSLDLLGKFIAVKEPNIRYLGLETMTKIAAIPSTLPTIRKHLSTIQYSLKQSDLSVRRRALDLMFASCDSTNCEEVVGQLMQYLDKADFNLKEEMVLKIAILSERYASNYKWYLDTIFKLIGSAGDFVSIDIVYRVIQIVSNQEDLQEYAAQRCFDELKLVNVHGALVSVGAYILGEYGHLIEEKGANGKLQFDLLHHQFPLVDMKVKAMLLTAYMKMANMYPYLKDRIQEVFKVHLSFIDAEIQQRAAEYMYMLKSNDEDLMSKVWELMPPFPERESILPKRLRTSTGSDVALSPRIKRDQQKSSEAVSEEDEEDEENESEDDESENEIILPKQQAKGLRKLLLGDSGVLYECDFLQLGCKMQLSESSQVKMILYYGNKSETETIEKIELSEPSSALKMQAKPADPFDVEPKKQAMQMFLFTSFSPFPACPEFILRFKKEGKSFKLPISLPLSTFKFGSPLEMDNTTFIELWKNHHEELKSTISSPTSKAVTSKILKETIAKGLKLFVVEGVDPNPQNAVLSGQFHYMSSSSNLPKSAPVLLRIGTGDVLRIACHSNSSLVNAAVDTAIKFLFDPPQDS